MILCVHIPMSKFPSSNKNTSHTELRACPNLVQPHLNLVIYANPVFPNKSTFTGPMSGHRFGEMVLHPVREASGFLGRLSVTPPRHLPLFTPLFVSSLFPLTELSDSFLANGLQQK